MKKTELVKNALVLGIVLFVVVPLAIPGLVFLALQQNRK